MDNAHFLLLGSKLRGFLTVFNHYGALKFPKKLTMFASNLVPLETCEMTPPGLLKLLLEQFGTQQVVIPPNLFEQTFIGFCFIFSFVNRPKVMSKFKFKCEGNVRKY